MVRSPVLIGIAALYDHDMRWPSSFYEMRDGDGCPMCAEGRPDSTTGGVRFYAGDYADAYLNRADIQRGYTIVIWRSRHVAEPTELSPEEASGYLQELLTVARAIELALEPVKMNYNVLGNSVPHLHTHIVPRYADDPRPGWPFPFPETEPRAIPTDVLERDLTALRSALAGGI